MGRLFIMIALLLALAVLAAMAGQAVQAGHRSLKEAQLPDTVQKVSYILLIVLMFGVVTGWLGGL